MWSLVAKIYTLAIGSPLPKRKGEEVADAPTTKRQRTEEVTVQAAAALSSVEASSATSATLSASKEVARNDLPLLKALQIINFEHSKKTNTPFLLPELLLIVVQYAHEDSLEERLLQAAQNASDTGEFSEINSRTSRSANIGPVDVLDAIKKHVANPKFKKDPRAYVEKCIQSESECGYTRGQVYGLYCGKASCRFSSIAFIEHFLASESKPPEATS